MKLWLALKVDHLESNMPKRPTKRGFKVWCRSDSKTGYTCAFQVYTGKVGDSTEKNLGARVVKDLSKDIQDKTTFYFSIIFLLVLRFWLTLWILKFTAQRQYWLLGRNFQSLMSPGSKH